MGYLLSMRPPALEKEGEDNRRLRFREVQTRKWDREPFPLSGEQGGGCRGGKGRRLRAGEDLKSFEGQIALSNSAHIRCPVESVRTINVGRFPYDGCVGPVTAAGLACLFGEGVWSDPTCWIPHKCCSQPQRHGGREMVISLITVFKRKEG